MLENLKRNIKVFIFRCPFVDVSCFPPFFTKVGQIYNLVFFSLPNTFSTVENFEDDVEKFLNETVSFL